MSLRPADLLTVARFARPGKTWSVARDGRVVADDGTEFSLANRADLEAAQIRLQDKGIKINAVTRRGKEAYRATRVNGSATETASIEALILRCVGEATAT